MKAEDEKAVGHVEEAGEVGLTVKKTETMQEQEFQKQMVKDRVFDLQGDTEKLDKDGDKLQVPKQATKAIKNEFKAEKAGKFFLDKVYECSCKVGAPNFEEKYKKLMGLFFLPLLSVQSASLPLPMTIAGWPGGLPPIGCGITLDFFCCFVLVSLLLL